MDSESWQVRFSVEGEGGEATASVPVAAISRGVLPMQRRLGVLLAVLGLILCAGMIGIVIAAVREGRLKPGETASEAQRRRGILAGLAALAVIALALWGGAKWWDVEAAAVVANVYHPTSLKADLYGNRLALTLGTYRQRPSRKEEPVTKDNLLLDHGHIMHLYAIREPEMDAVFHLHPSGDVNGEFGMTLPSMPPGEYRLYADIVHTNAFPETLTTTVHVPEGMQGGTLGSEDAEAMPPALSKGELGTEYRLPDGYSMVWDRPENLVASKAYVFRFRLLDKAGHPAQDMRPYLGMAGHAAFVKTDGTVFAHTHPDGSAAMPAMMMANGEAASGAMSDMEGMEMPGMEEKIAPVVEFPYGFPSAGRYRIFIQMKHGGAVETGVFDAEVH
jgi:hypothetical protein